jgi:hypothetical protein
MGSLNGCSFEGSQNSHMKILILSLRESEGFSSGLSCGGASEPSFFSIKDLQIANLIVGNNRHHRIGILDKSDISVRLIQLIKTENLSTVLGCPTGGLPRSKNWGVRWQGDESNLYMKKPALSHYICQIKTIDV